MGDSDLNGLVDLDDWYIWRANIESDPSITWPKEVNPGYIIDPDFNNDNDVETLNDLPLWAANYGKEYL